MKETIKKINDLQKALKEIENTLDNVRNTCDYDTLQATKAIFLYDLRVAAEELVRLTNIKCEVQDEMLSNNAQNIVTKEFEYRLKKAI